MTGACCQNTWGTRGLTAVTRGTVSREGEERQRLEQRVHPNLLQSIHLKGTKGTLDRATRFPKRLLINTSCTSPKALLSETGKVWGQWTDGTGVA